MNFKKNNLMKNIEEKSAKFLKNNIYCWYLGRKGTHQEKLDAVWEGLERIALPPLSDTLKIAIVAYIDTRNKVFEAVISTALDSN